ncbi:MAG: UDP-N-acetylmuramoyl-L-alanyl-D-glutamate--2,6-diaminopimelate ligase [Kofleriaceae bacterium]|nr:UDP-N-acetylmuramoyl-L-alanyl-D-glutamate--2,6-diaminopimelate ligase [Kofleriaceae bacterium]
MLRQLIDGLADARLIGDGDVTVNAVRDDSRKIEPGDVFVAVKGMRSDGHAFVQTAIERGAVALVVEHEVDAPKNVPQVIVPKAARALGPLVGRVLGDPAKAMTLVGITGTNGKTTTTYLVESILAAAGYKPGVIGTVEMRWPGKSIPASYTTPTPQMLHEALANMREAGCTHVVMETTSIAVVQDRLAGLQFAVQAFSNLTQDHLDIHGSMAAYRDAKRELFATYLAKTGTAVVNVDDPEGEGMGAAAGKALRVSVDGHAAEIRVTKQESTVKGITATLATPTGELEINARPLIGHYNVANLALAVGIAEALGIAHDKIAAGIAALPGVPGRVERVANDADLDILVDYAHTPDALRNVLSAVRPLTKRRLICVFGCGGDRDPTKRPKMGAAVAELADLAVVTSDNPRTENPQSIIDQILPAVPKPFFVDVDRKTAIRAAIAEATPGDVVVIAGKGHEDYQILGTTKIHFDDREEAAAAAKEREHRLAAGLTRDAGGELLGDGNVVCDRIVIDSRAVRPGTLYVAIRGETHDGHRFCKGAIEAGATAVLVDREGLRAAPELASQAAVIVVDDTRIALGKIARAHRRAWANKLVAITGSAGKTTTKELTRAALAATGTTHAAEGSLNNETGVPLTLLGLHLFHQFGVVEMGMRGMGQIEYLTKIAEPDVAVVVNAGTAHIELLGSTDKIAEAKGEIWMGLRPGGTVVRPFDDLRLEHWSRLHAPAARHVTFGEVEGADVRLVKYTPTDAGGIVEIDAFGELRTLQLQLVGKHAAIDACAALAAAHAAGASVDQALAGLARARPPAMRGEIVELGGRKVIVDCYNANPASMAAALRTLAERAHGLPAIAVVGDMLELGDHAPAAHRDVGTLAKELGIGVVAIGEQAKHVVETAGADAEHVSSPAEAAERALARTEKAGGWILLKASRGMKLERVLDAMKERTP